MPWCAFPGLLVKTQPRGKTRRLAVSDEQNTGWDIKNRSGGSFQRQATATWRFSEQRSPGADRQPVAGTSNRHLPSDRPPSPSLIRPQINGVYRLYL